VSDIEKKHDMLSERQISTIAWRSPILGSSIILYRFAPSARSEKSLKYSSCWSIVDRTEQDRMSASQREGARTKGKTVRDKLTLSAPHDKSMRFFFSTLLRGAFRTKF